ncbi:MAG: glycosyltransferase family 2 protein [Thiomargarita sp.]|nr:glycosyltransferase family 2 protein [Thiomargarita sp.]
MPNKIAIIILNWKGWHDTIACLDSLKQLVCPKPVSIIVCDNNSQDNSYHSILNWAAKNYTPSAIGLFFYNEQFLYQNNQQKTVLTQFSFFPFIFIQIERNLGFAGGNNVGIQYILNTQQYQYIWVLNNDTVVDSYALIHLYQSAFQHPQAAIIGSTIIDFQNPDRIQCAGGCQYSPLFSTFNYVLAGKSLNSVMQYNKQINLDYIYGASMFLRIDVIKKVGLLNEEYFLFYEELDYAQRVKQHGYKIAWCKNSLVYHQGSASIGNVQTASREQLARANYYETLSTLKYTANFYPYLLAFVMIFRFLGKSFFLLLRREFYLFIPLCKAYQDFIKSCFIKNS